MQQTKTSASSNESSSVAEPTGKTVTEEAVAPEEISLALAKQGHSYLIISSSVGGRNRMRMDSLGLIPGEAVHVLFSNFSGLVIAIKGSRLAISKKLASSLLVREFNDSDWPHDA